MHPSPGLPIFPFGPQIPLDCTYSTAGEGFVMQDVFRCLGCGVDGFEVGLCTGCARTCHSGHFGVELVTRTLFRCDCGVQGHNLRSPVALLSNTVQVYICPLLFNTFRVYWCAEFCTSGPTYLSVTIPYNMSIRPGRRFAISNFKKNRSRLKRP